jgi:large subunit ribosomal protein L21
MFAVIRTGGKQYRVAERDVIAVDKILGAPGDIVELGEVLIIGGADVVVGTPTISGASVAAEVLEQGRGAKIIAFKKRRRKNSRRKRGHRQEFSLLRITEILTEGRKPSRAKGEAAAQPAPRKAAAPVAETAVAAGVAPVPVAEPAAPTPQAEAKPAEARPKPQPKAEPQPEVEAKEKPIKPKAEARPSKKPPAKPTSAKKAAPKKPAAKKPAAKKPASGADKGKGKKK